MEKPMNTHQTHFYIISWNTHTEEWEVNSDTEADLFPDGTIFDYDNQCWYRDYNGDGEYHPRADELGEQVAKAIEFLNRGK